MPIRITALTVTVIALTLGLVISPLATAQVDRVVDPNWTTPRTADGQPDLQGLWGNKTSTPMERPDSAEGRAFLTDEEIAANNRQRVLSMQAQDDAPAQRTEAGANVGGYGSYWLDSGETVLSTGQTSLIVDPPDGRAPIKRWALEAKAYSLAHESDHYRYLSLLDRCVSGCPGLDAPRPGTTTRTASCRRLTTSCSSTRWSTSYGSFRYLTMPTSTIASACGWVTRGRIGTERSWWWRRRTFTIAVGWRQATLARG